jgi:ABC-2 type transport system permease protein
MSFWDAIPGAAGVLWRREVLQFARRPGRVVAALGQPLLLWLLLGSGLGSAFRFAEQDYRSFFFPGMLFLIVLFSTVFSTISVIEDRQRGFLRAVLASPAPRAALLLGKCLGSASLATLQGALILFLAPLAGLSPAPAGVAAALAILFLYALALSALGWGIAWISETTAGFHAALNFLILPMWFLSGAVFPAAKSPVWLALLVSLNPLAYGMEGLRAALAPGRGLGGPAPWIVGLAFAAAAAAFGLAVSRRGADRR